MAGVLYYPFFNAPTPVLRQAILYWDNIATVVAPGWKGRISSEMREAHDAGLYRPIRPYEEFYPFALASIEAELDHALSAIPLDDLLPPNDEFEQHTNILHLEKMHESVAEELRRRRLVREVPGMPGRLVGSPTLIHVVISILADQIARQTNDREGFTSTASLRPHTDLPLAHRLALEPIPGRPSAPCWQVDIGQLLPVPTGDLSISDLLRFRAEHDEERRAMMSALDDLLMRLAHGQHPEDVLRSVRRELEEATSALHGAARATWRGWSRRSIAATVAAGASYAGGVLADAPHALAAASLTLVGGVMINVATDSIRSDAIGTDAWQQYRVRSAFQACSNAAEEPLCGVGVRGRLRRAYRRRTYLEPIPRCR